MSRLEKLQKQKINLPQIANKQNCRLVWLNKQEEYFSHLFFCVCFILNNGKWTSKNQILDNSAFIIHNKGIFYFDARIDPRQRRRRQVMSLSQKHKKWWLQTDCVQMSEVLLITQTQVSRVVLWLVSHLNTGPWLVRQDMRCWTFYNHGPNHQFNGCTV